MKSKVDEWKIEMDNTTGEYWWVCTSASGPVRGVSKERFKKQEACIQDARRFGYPGNYKAPSSSAEFWNE